MVRFAHHYRRRDTALSPRQNGSVKNYIGSDGFIHNIYSGHQTLATLKAATRELTDLTAKLRSEGKPVLVLTDITNLTGLNLAARRYAVEMVKQIDFDKVAVFGNDSLLKTLVNFIVLATGRGFKLKYFGSRKEAESRLRT